MARRNLFALGRAFLVEKVTGNGHQTTAELTDWLKKRCPDATEAKVQKVLDEIRKKSRCGASAPIVSSESKDSAVSFA